MRRPYEKHLTLNSCATASWTALMKITSIACEQARRLENYYNREEKCVVT